MEQSCQLAIKRHWNALETELANQMTASALGKYVSRNVLTVRQRKNILKSNAQCYDKVGMFLKYAMEKKGTDVFDVLVDSLSENKKPTSGLALMLSKSRQNIQKDLQKANTPRETITIPKHLSQKFAHELSKLEEMLDISSSGNVEELSFSDKVRKLTEYRKRMEHFLFEKETDDPKIIPMPLWLRKIEKVEAQLNMKSDVIQVLRGEIVDFKDKIEEYKDEIELLKRENAEMNSKIAESELLYAKLQERHKKNLLQGPGTELEPDSQDRPSQVNNFIDNRTYHNTYNTVVTNADSLQVGSGNVVSKSNEQTMSGSDGQYGIEMMVPKSDEHVVSSSDGQYVFGNMMTKSDHSLMPGSEEQ